MCKEKQTELADWWQNKPLSQEEHTCGCPGRDLHVHTYLVLSRHAQVPGGVAELQLLQGHAESPDSVVADGHWRVFKAPLAIRRPTGAPVSAPAPLLHAGSADRKSQGSQREQWLSVTAQLRLPVTKKPVSQLPSVAHAEQWGEKNIPVFRTVCASNCDAAPLLADYMVTLHWQTCKKKTQQNQPRESIFQCCNAACIIFHLYNLTHPSWQTPTQWVFYLVLRSLNSWCLGKSPLLHFEAPEEDQKGKTRSGCDKCLGQIVLQLQFKISENSNEDSDEQCD